MVKQSFIISLLATVVTIGIFVVFVSRLECFVTRNNRNLLSIVEKKRKTSITKINNSSMEGLDHNVWSFSTFIASVKDYPSSSTLIPNYIFRMSPYPLLSAHWRIIKALNDTAKSNPDMVQIYLDDEDGISFINNHVTKKEIQKAYHALIPTAYKSDLLRLLLIYKFGGFYNDIGHVFKQSLHKMASFYDEFVTAPDRGCSEFAIHNAFLGAFPKHPLVKFMINYCVNNVLNKEYGVDCLDICGPAAMGRAFNLFFKLPNTTLIKTGNYTMMDRYRCNIATDLGATVLTKFESYYDVMYHQRGRQHYYELWKKREVFNETVLKASSV
jgi:mannosyltransferase OCH1-like enzyme